MVSINITNSRPWPKAIAGAPDKIRGKLVGTGIVQCHLEMDRSRILDLKMSLEYIGVIIKIPSEQKIYAMYVKNNLCPSSSNGLAAEVPCDDDTSVQYQAEHFPVEGLSGSCQKDHDDYWMAFGNGEVTICFPGVACFSWPKVCSCPF